MKELHWLRMWAAGLREERGGRGRERGRGKEGGREGEREGGREGEREEERVLKLLHPVHFNRERGEVEMRERENKVGEWEGERGRIIN